MALHFTEDELGERRAKACAAMIADGLDALLSTAQMPKGVPVGTLAIGKAGAINAAILAVRILALSRPELDDKLRRFYEEEAAKVAGIELTL